jgi:hypothetical protein
MVATDAFHTKIFATDQQRRTKAPPPLAVPVQVTGVVAVGLMFAPEGLEADGRLSAGSATATKVAIKHTAINTRRAPRAPHENC